MEIIVLETNLRGRITTASRRHRLPPRLDMRAAAIAVANAININAGITPEQVTVETVRTLAHALKPFAAMVK